MFMKGWRTKNFLTYQNNLYQVLIVWLVISCNFWHCSSTNGSSFMKARRAFRALKGIIRLQALIRGHLVRRQAVVTLCSMYGIVKFQALVRGGRVRQSNVGSEIHEKCNILNPLVIFQKLNSR